MYVGTISNLSCVLKFVAVVLTTVLMLIDTLWYRVYLGAVENLDKADSLHELVR